MSTSANGEPRSGSEAPARRGSAAAHAVRLDWVESAEIDDTTTQPDPPLSWWNTGVSFVRNGTTSILRVLNQETRESRTASPGGSVFADWFLPWCNSYDEVATKALLFRAVPPSTPSARGSRLFYIFQDYTSDTAMWLPPGVPDFGARDFIELSPGSGMFLKPASRVDLSAVVNPLNGLIVPGASVVTP